MIDIEIIGYILVGLGVFFTLTGTIGILRLPDFYTRLHPAGVIDSLGAPITLVGLLCLTEFSFISLKIILLIAFLLITSPTACHALAKAALLSEHKPLKKKSTKKQ